MKNQFLDIRNLFLQVIQVVNAWSPRKRFAACVPVLVLSIVVNLNWYRVPLPKVNSKVGVNGDIVVTTAKKAKKPDTVTVTVCYSKTNRGTWYNIKRSAKKFNGVTMQPGDDFSWLRDIGKCNRSEGYAPGGGFDGYEIGGGVCFTATAFFRMMYTINEEIDPGFHCHVNSHHEPVWYATDRNDATVDADHGIDVYAWNDSNRTMKVKVKVNESRRTVTFIAKIYPSK